MSSPVIKVSALVVTNNIPVEGVVVIIVNGVEHPVFPPYDLTKIPGLSSGDVFTVRFTIPNTGASAVCPTQFTFDPNAGTAAVFLITGSLPDPVIVYEGTTPIN